MLAYPRRSRAYPIIKRQPYTDLPAATEVPASLFNVVLLGLFNFPRGEPKLRLFGDRPSTSSESEVAEAWVRLRDEWSPGSDLNWCIFVAVCTFQFFLLTDLSQRSHLRLDGSSGASSSEL